MGKRTAKKTKSERVKHYVQTGLKHIERSNYKAALRAYEQALSLATIDPEIFFYMGFVYEDLGMLELALEYYRRALALAPTMVRALEYSGVVYHKLRQYEKALQYYNKAIKLEPDYPYVYYNKAITLGAMGKLK